MGTLKSLAGQRLYIDANFFISGLESAPGWAEVFQQISNAIDTGLILSVTSDLTLAECLIKPMELGRADVVEAYLSAIQSRRFLTVAPITREVLIRAARQRAVSRIKLPDAIHLATIRVTNLSKCYQIHDAPHDRLKQFVAPRLQRLAGQSPKQYFREFWALKHVFFEIRKGEHYAHAA